MRTVPALVLSLLAAATASCAIRGADMPLVTREAESAIVGLGASLNIGATVTASSVRHHDEVPVMVGIPACSTVIARRAFRSTYG